MTDVQDTSAGAEPSMEEILASIRRIIADEKDPNAAEPAPEPKEDVLELNQMVADDGSIVNVKEMAPEPITPEPLIELEPVPSMVVEEPLVKEDADALLSTIAESAAASSLTALANTLHVEKKAAFTSYTPLGDGSKTIEGIVMELIKPMLKEWLDANLPPVVERLVQKEVERIARRVQE